MLEELYHSNFRGHQQPSTESLQNTFDRIVDGFHPVPIYIVIDSLDECVDRVESLGWIYSLAGRRRENLHIIVASRPESDIIDILQQEDFINCVDLMDEVDQDIELYLEEHVGRLADVKKWKEETRQAVKSTLADGAQGMFQWVSLQLVGLKKCPNEQSVLKQLKSLPKGLDKTYDLILSKIDEDYHLHTQTFLRWLCFSAHPMSLEEIAETIVVDFDFEDGPRCDPARRYNNKRDVLEKCAGLITESGGTNSI
ncbi:hypothetical protein BDN70DRAFT_807702 [Pholiota conissans]|uniref:Nephrocystin 3-like N-terminal domain-containing protein n=1 Tax=Pholiota conissans TaxID=109636 RepID=A0A9P5Z0R3_9AGAR|nr:hypothetical protein BDN70DRAFT_807702 [Pholiota conissans]